MTIHHRHGIRHLIVWSLLCAQGAIIGVATGFVIGAFRLIRDALFPMLAAWLALWREQWWIVPLWGLLLVGLARLLSALVHAVPLISGSGIPQTELVVTGKLHIPRIVWGKVLAAKFAGSSLSSLGGLSLGREGPCIQMGGATASLVSVLWDRFAFTGHIHVAAGAAAGMAAAFGAPLAGLFFVFEEMKSRFTRGGLLITLCATLCAHRTVSDLFGMGRIFPFADFAAPGPRQFWVPVLLALLTGVLGAGYARALLAVKNAEARRPLLADPWRILPPLAAAWILAFLCPPVLGGGDDLVEMLGRSARALAEGGAGVMGLRTLLFLCALKTMFSLLSYTGNVPGGILMPMLCLGALLGALAGHALTACGLLEPEVAGSCVIFGMIGFFSAMVRAPLTGMTLVLEMTGSLACLPGALVVSLLAAATAGFLKQPPVYDSLRAAIIVSSAPGKK